MTKGDLLKLVRENPDAITTFLYTNTHVLSELDLALDDPFHALNLKRGQKFYESVLGCTYIITKTHNNKYQLVNIDTGGYYTPPTDNIENVFGDSRFKFTKLP